MEDCSHKNITFRILNCNDYLDISVFVYNIKLFNSLFKLPGVDLAIIKRNLEEQQYDIMSCNEEKIQFKTKGGVIITAYSITNSQLLLEKIQNLTEKVEQLSNINHSSKNWISVGKLKNIAELLSNYPSEKYNYGMKYNTYTIEEVLITSWNRGYRVFFSKFYPHGDSATGLHSGTAIFTKDTDDNESKGIFYHRYVNSDFKPCCGSNGNADNLDVYVRIR